MQNEITCLIFDFDGVIANTDLGRFKALQKILPEYDIKLSKSLSEKNFIGLSTKGFLTKKSKGLSEKQIDEIVKKRHELFFSNLSSYCIPYDNMKKTIEQFHSKFDLAIVTTNSTKNVTILLKHLGILNLFKWVIGREKSENDKLLKTYSLIPQLINKKVAECIVIEDSDFGINAARKEGFYCIRFDPENAFKKKNENVKVRSYRQLKDIIIKNTGVDNV